MLEKMEVYIVNLRRYNENRECGAWFNVPINYDEVKEKISFGEEDPEYAIHDYCLPFQIGEYTSFSEINEIVEQYEELEDTLKECMGELARAFFSNDYEEFFRHTEDLIFYPDCHSMEDVANECMENHSIDRVMMWFDDEEYASDNGYFEEDIIRNQIENEGVSSVEHYVDFEGIGRDMEIEGNFYLTENNGYVEYIG